MLPGLIERIIVLHRIDTQWQEHLRAMDDLRQSIGLRAYGQRDPLVEYKREAFKMFEELMGNTSTMEICRATTGGPRGPALRERTPRSARSGASTRVPARRTPAAAAPVVPRRAVTMNGRRSAPAARWRPVRAGRKGGAEVQSRREGPKVGRNDPCPCGSGKKYKKCHGS